LLPVVPVTKPWLIAAVVCQARANVMLLCLRY
jgi:hypothetical protein